MAARSIDLDATARSLDAMLAPKLGGRALVSVNKAVVTQASSAIPVVPLYLSLLSKVLREKASTKTPSNRFAGFSAIF